MRIIAGEWKGRRLTPVKGPRVRPTTDRVREAWMSIVAPSLPGARVLDLFAGSGALGLEALSRGAAEVVFVERSRGALRVLEANVERVGAGDRSRVERREAFAYLSDLTPGAFDLALADPPYESGFADRLLRTFARNPFARELWVEHRVGEPLPQLSGLRRRRYGDTALSCLAAVDLDEES